MEKEFLNRCRAKLLESEATQRKYDDDQGILFDMTTETVSTILKELNPVTETSMLFIVPALRHIADVFESDLTKEGKVFTEFMYKELIKGAVEIEVREASE